MKNKEPAYEEPKIEVIYLSETDIITSSVDDDPYATEMDPIDAD